MSQQWPWFLETESESSYLSSTLLCIFHVLFFSLASHFATNVRSDSRRHRWITTLLIVSAAGSLACTVACDLSAWASALTSTVWVVWGGRLRRRWFWLGWSATLFAILNDVFISSSLSWSSPTRHSRNAGCCLTPTFYWCCYGCCSTILCYCSCLTQPKAQLTQLTADPQPAPSNTKYSPMPDQSLPSFSHTYSQVF